MDYVLSVANLANWRVNKINPWIAMMEFKIELIE